MYIETPAPKLTFAMLMSAMLMSTPLVPAVAADGLRMPKASIGANNSAQPSGFSSGPNSATAAPSKPDDKDKGLNNYIKACHDWGGGPSTDPEGNSRCTRPDGTTVVDS